MKRDGVIWLDRGWQNVFIGFCPSRQAWERYLKKTKWKESVPYPPDAGSNGCCTRFTDETGKTVILVTIDADRRVDPLETIGLIAHECMHVYQYVLKGMNEHKASPEFEAYSYQAILQMMLHAYLKSRGLRLTVRRQKKAG